MVRPPKSTHPCPIEPIAGGGGLEPEGMGVPCRTAWSIGRSSQRGLLTRQSQGIRGQAFLAEPGAQNPVSPLVCGLVVFGTTGYTLL